MALPDLPGVPKALDRGVRLLLEGLREHVRELRGLDGDPKQRAVTLNEVTVGNSTTIVLPGTGGGGSTTPDYTPPPTPTGVSVTPTFSNLIIEHDTPLYTVGHGHARTKVYGAAYGGSGPLPVFADAVLITEFVGTVFAHGTTLGTAWHIWLKWVSVDGVESTAPAGGTNGYTATTGKVGSSDLGTAVVLSQALAPGSVTADKAALEIGGSNLVGNNSFELDSDGDGLADGWGQYNNTAGTEPSTYTRTPGRISGLAQRCTWTGTNTSSKGLLTGAPWKPNSTYVLSWYARSNVAQGGGTHLAWNVAPASITTLRNPNLTTSWQRYAYRLTTGAAVDSTIFITIAYGAAMTGWVEFDDVQLEEGDTLTGYAGKLALNTIVAGDGAIANFAVTNLLVANGAIDDLKVANVSVAKLLAGALAVGQYIKSTNYVAGTSGWIIQADGSAEFGAAAIRGQLSAAQINTNGLTIRKPDGTIILDASGTGTPIHYSSVLADGGWLNSNQQWSQVLNRPADDAIRNNLIDVSWWKRGATIPWGLNGEENIIYTTDDVGGTGPRGGSDIVWYCREASGDGGSGGGWDTGITLDPSKTYRFVVPVRVRDTGLGGNVYWGTYNVCNLNTTSSNSNPYFISYGRNSMSTDRWYLMVGYVFPYGSVSNSNAGSGLIDCKTGQFVATGTNWNHDATGANNHRAYQYYAGANATQLFGRPMINLVDGTEPSLREYFEQSAVLNSAQQWSDVSGAGKPQDNANQTYVDGGGAIQGVASGAGTTVNNDLIGINSSGQFYGGGAGTGIVVSNAQMSIGVDGKLYSAGVFLGTSATLSGMGAGAMALINQITNANVSTYIAGAAIELAQIKVASINTLSALSSFMGTVEIAAGGYLRSGKTSFSDTSAGFYLANIAGDPQFAVGNSTSWLKFSPSTGFELKLPPFSASIPAGDIYVYVGNGGASYGSRTVSVTGGNSPYSYKWRLVSLVGDNGTPVYAEVNTGAYSATATFTGSSVDNIVTATFECTVVDANGRIAETIFTIYATHGTPP